MIIELVCAFICIFICVKLTDLFLQYRNKLVHGGDCKRFRWHFRLRHYEIEIPPPQLSTYYFKYSDQSKADLRTFVTYDDPFIKQISEDFEDLFGSMPPAFKALCLQAMIQQNVKYQSDDERFPGCGMMWCYPCRTAEYKTGDCIDSTLLFTSIAVNIGLDVVIVKCGNHALPGIRLFDDGEISLLETTSFVPLPAFNSRYNITEILEI